MKMIHVLWAAIISLTLVGCSLPRATTTHLSWTFDRNLIVVGALVDGIAGEFLVGSSHSETVLDAGFAGAKSGRRTVPVAMGRYSATARPVQADLQGLTDGVLGADVWSGRSLTIDYKRRLLILGRALEPVDQDARHRFAGAPAIPITIDGREERAIIDTANPDTILLPMERFGPEGRIDVELVLGGVRFQSVDAAVAPISEIRLGNRILSEFLVTVDYRRREVSLWPNP